MGYYVDLQDCNFKIDAKNNNSTKVVNQVKKCLLDNMEKLGGGFSSWFDDKLKKRIEKRSYAWVETKELKRAKNLSSLLEAFGYPPEIDEKGNVTSISHSYEKIGDEAYLFKAIAPYVVKGSYLDFIGEDNALWRYYFDGKQMIEKQGKIVFEE